MNSGIISPTELLSETETRAGLRAVGRVIQLAGEHARRSEHPDRLADVLTAARGLPELLAEPDEFRVRFRPALQKLVDRHREFAPVLNEFDRATGVRRCHPPEDDLWFDCGGGGGG